MRPTSVSYPAGLTKLYRRTEDILGESDHSDAFHMSQRRRLSVPEAQNAMTKVLESIKVDRAPHCVLARLRHVTVSNREPQSSWWLQVPIWELPFRNHFRNFPALFRTRKYWSSRKYRKCHDCICLTLLSSSSYSIYYYTLKLSSRIITTILYKCTSTHSIYTFTLVVMCQARLGLKALAWAGLCRAQA